MIGGHGTSADVVIVGGGNAALVAALAAHEDGARVLVLEAAPEKERGGNSRFTGGIFRCAHEGLDDLATLLTDDSKQWLDRVEVEPYPFARYADELERATRGRADRKLISAVIEQSLQTVRWMAEHGVRWELSVGKLIDPGNLGEQQTYTLPPGGALRSANEGVGLMEDLYRAVEEREIEVWYDAPVVELLIDGTACSGVVVRRTGGDVAVRGSVVLAAGGFEANPQLRQRWLGPGWDLVKVRGSRFNMGTVLESALRSGAQPTGHWGGCHAVPLDAEAPDVGDLRLTDRMSRYSYPYALLLNADAQRFVDEGEDEVWLTYAKTGAAIRAQQGAWAFQLFDQRTVHLLEPRYATGSPVMADSLDELAERLDVDAEALQATVSEFNEVCPAGTFDAFAKDGLRAAPQGQPVKSNWAQPIDEPPYVAYAVTCGITFTYGGLSIDDSARVQDTAGRPIEGLYATGEITGGFFYHNYPAGTGLMRGAVFGRIAGRAAAAHAAAR